MERELLKRQKEKAKKEVPVLVITMVQVCFPNGECSKGSQDCDFTGSVWWKEAHFPCKMSFLLSSAPLSFASEYTKPVFVTAKSLLL